MSDQITPNPVYLTFTSIQYRDPKVFDFVDSPKTEVYADDFMAGDMVIARPDQRVTIRMRLDTVQATDIAFF
jgi:hypothetical protein